MPMMSPSFFLLLFLLAKLTEYFFFLWLHYLNANEVKKNSFVPERFSSRMPQEKYSQSRQYTLAKSRFGFYSETYDLLVLLAFLFSGGFTLFENISVHFSSSEWLQGIIFCFTIIVGKEIIDMPFDLYFTFILEKKYGFNKMTASLYIKDFIKKILLSFLLGAPLIVFLLWVIRATGDKWWIYGFGAVTGFQLFIMWIYPVWISPLFNRFVPLENGELRSRIMNIAREIRFNISEIFVMDGSKRSTHSNAYFTGFGKNRRIVLFDTLIKSLSTNELVGVLTHEMAHNKLKHIRKFLILSLLLTGTGFYIWNLLLYTPEFYQAFGLKGEHLFPSLILFPMLLGPFSFLLAPFMNFLSRKHEFEADAFAAKVTHSPNDLKEALLKLNEENLSNLTPHPLYSFFYYSHPTLAERLNSLDKI
ncbi:MAG: M48 family metallopeptidase [Candidatus Aureabacteria bacterium]|nr:M48 family metallopeptidase [Candidatus Auribacterota bacterium]